MATVRALAFDMSGPGSNPAKALPPPLGLQVAKKQTNGNQPSVENCGQ